MCLDSKADPGFEVRGGTNGLENLKVGGGGGGGGGVMWIYFNYTIIKIYIFQLRYTSNTVYLKPHYTTLY